jgi:hypothetical protein
MMTLLALILSQTGCNKNANIVMPNGQDFIIFGYVYGECGGDCRDLFLITADGAFWDAGQLVELKNTEFEDTPMSDSAFIEARKMWAIPKSLRKNKVKTRDLKQFIADVDYYIYGEIANSEFEILYDAIDSTTNRELFDYSLVVAEVIRNIR